MTTLSKLLTQFDDVSREKPLFFETDEGPIGGDYHVTELMHSTHRGIDCGGNLETWEETRLQLLDGEGNSHMSVGKLGGIVKRSLGAMPELADADFVVEFGHKNERLNTMQIGEIDVQNDAVFIKLAHKTAVCKPSERALVSPSVQKVELQKCCA